MIADAPCAPGQVDAEFQRSEHGIARAARQLAPLLGDDTTVVTLQNGLPWWYFQGTGGRFDAFQLERVDPGGIIAGAIEASRVVGSIVYVPAERVAPGHIRHAEGSRIPFGEPAAARSARARPGSTRPPGTCGGEASRPALLSS